MASRKFAPVRAWAARARSAARAPLHERLGALDPDGPLVAIFGELAGEEQARDRGSPLGGSAREVARAVIARVVGLRDGQVARVRLEVRRIVALDESLERLDGPFEGARGRAR